VSGAVSVPSAFARWTSILLHPFAVFAALALIAAWRMDPASLPRTAIGMAVAVAIVWAFVMLGLGLPAGFVAWDLPDPVTDFDA